MIRHPLTPALALAAVLTLTGCGGGQPAAAPSPSASTSGPAPATSAAGLDTATREACQANAAAQEAGTTDDPEIMWSVAQAAKNAGAGGVAQAGALLERAADRAIAAKGADDEPAMQAYVVAASFDLVTACAKAGVVG